MTNKNSARVILAAHHFIRNVFKPLALRQPLLVFIGMLTLVGCKKDDDTLFTKMDASDTGIDFVNQNHETERSNILTYEYFYNGGGVAIGDINNDQLAD